MFILINDLIRKSVEYAFTHPADSKPFIKEHAQEMDEAVMQKHIDLYVNQYSIDLGELGKKAVDLLMKKAKEMGVIKDANNELFV